MMVCAQCGLSLEPRMLVTLREPNCIVCRAQASQKIAGRTKLKLDPTFINFNLM